MQSAVAVCSGTLGFAAYMYLILSINKRVVRKEPLLLNLSHEF